MAGTAYGSFAVGDANLDNLMLQTAAVERGHCALTLTEMTTTAIPQIAAGSRIEINGTLFKFDANDTISGSATAGTNYVRMVISGTTATPTWSTVSPTWFDSKQGWYDATGAYRYIPYICQLISTEYKKIAFDPSQKGSAGIYFGWEFYGGTGTITAETTVSLVQATPVNPPWGMLLSSGYITIPFSGMYIISTRASTNNATYPGRGFVRINTPLTGTAPGAPYCINPSHGYTMSETMVTPIFLTQGDKLYLSGESPSSSANIQIFCTITKVA